MAGDYRVKNRLLLVEPEAVSGVAETPTPAANAILVEEPVPVPSFEVIQTNEASGSLDGRGPIVGGGFFGINGRFYLKGAGTAGVAPEYGPLLRAAALVQTLPVAKSATAQAGSTSSTIVLDAAASAVDDFYKGRVIELTGGTGSGQKACCTAYNGTTKTATITPNWSVTPDGTTTFTIAACALYVPISTGLETVTAWLYDHSALAATNSLLRQIFAAAANVTLEATTRGVVRATFALRGIMPANPTNVAHPGAGTFNATRPRPFLSTDAYIGQVAGKFRSFTLDLGNTVQQADDPAAAFGYGIAGVTTRRMIGTINPLLQLLATRDAFADFIAGTPRALWMRWGSVAGNKVSILVPAATYTGATPADTDGFNAEELPFEATGIDSGAYICVY